MADRAGRAGNQPADALGNVVPLRVKVVNGHPVPEHPENCEPHTTGKLSGYLDWCEWQREMHKTHAQRQCTGCGLWSIWEPKVDPGE